MATLKETFTKSITTLNVKTNNFMEEAKSKTHISTLEDEIQKLKLQAGEVMYASWTKGEDAKEEVEKIFKVIADKFQEIKDEQERIRKLSEEEQQILGNGNQTPVQTQPPIQNPVQSGSGEVTFCSQCGMKNSAHYKFCCKCGKPLSE